MTPSFLVKNWWLFCHPQLSPQPLGFGSRQSPGREDSTSSPNELVSLLFQQGQAGRLTPCSPGVIVICGNFVQNPTNSLENTTFTSRLTPTPHLLRGPLIPEQEHSHLPSHPGVRLPEKQEHPRCSGHTLLPGQQSHWMR